MSKDKYENYDVDDSEDFRKSLELYEIFTQPDERPFFQKLIDTIVFCIIPYCIIVGIMAYMLFYPIIF